MWKFKGLQEEFFIQMWAASLSSVVRLKQLWDSVLLSDGLNSVI